MKRQQRFIKGGEFLSRIKIFTGHFGSGKTEFAINYALDLAKKGEKVVLADMDIVNPYFCSRDVEDILNQNSIRLIASNKKFSNAELAVVPAEVLAVFNDKSYQVIMDVGGDDQGAVVLGQYNRYFKEEPYDMFFVINNNRPLTESAADTIDYLRSVERVSRLKVTHLVSNTNLSYETKIEDILHGDKIVREVSEKTGIPYEYTLCRKDFLGELKGKVIGELYGLDIFMKPPWRQD